MLHRCKNLWSDFQLGALRSARYDSQSPAQFSGVICRYIAVLWRHCCEIEVPEVVLEKIDLLKKSILARAFRGELGTNDPTEESTLELLKSII